MSDYRFTLNGVVLEDEPEGWKDAKITKQRDQLIQGLFTLSTTSLVFHGDGYKILNDIINELGYQQVIEVLIEEKICQDNFEEFIKGAVFLSDIEKHNLTTKRITVPVTDDVFGKVINPNKSIKAFINVPNSKNNKQTSRNGAITLIQGTAELIDFFRPANGVYQGGLADRRAYKVEDVLRFMTEYMTDVEIGFRSDYLLDPNNFEGGIPYILTGAELRNAPSAKAPNISFGDLYRAMQRLTNLTISIEKDVTGRSIVRCEHTSSFFVDEISTEIRDIKDLSVNFNTDRIYSHLLIGNEPFFDQNLFGPIPTYDNSVRYLTFRDEDYIFRGEANVDNFIDLRTSTIGETKFITDTNMIESIVFNDTDEFDDDIFIVIVDPDTNQSGAAGGSAVRYSITGGAPFHYNQPLRNKEILEKWNGFLPNSVAKYIDSGNNTCFVQTDGASFGLKVRNTVDGQIASEIIPFVGFADDSTFPFNDPNNNFNTLSNRYVIPIAGQYSFESVIDIKLTRFGLTSVSKFKYIITLIHGNSVATPIESVTQILVIETDAVQTLFHADLSATFQNCNVADKIFVRLEIIPLNATWNAEHRVRNNSTFSCSGTEEDGGIYQAEDPKKYRSIEYEFGKPTSLETFKNLCKLADQKLIINECSDPTQDKEVFVESVTYNNTTSETEFLLTN